MSIPVTEHNLIEQFRLAFPELEAQYEARVQGWHGEGTPSNYEFVGFVFKPQFKRELQSRMVTGFLRRSAEFIERVCETGDPEAINVIWIKIFEWLLPRRNELKLLWPELGHKTKEKIKEAALRWGYSLAYLKDDLSTIY